MTVQNMTPSCPQDIAPEAYLTLSQGAEAVVETSCAVVILKGDFAYKLKKSVDFGFLDFSSEAKRVSALESELRLNQAFAPHIYQSVERCGSEPYLKMQRFDSDTVLAQASLDLWPEDKKNAIFQNLGVIISEFHLKAPVCQDEPHRFNIHYVISSNRDNLNRFKTDLGEAEVEAYNQAAEAAFAALRPLIASRLEQGFVRRCHGDMHLGNIMLEGDRPVLFDCIEFNDRLSQIDILYDLAFLLMDLWLRGEKGAANRLYNQWLEAMMRGLEAQIPEFLQGLRLLPLYISARAGVRAHVCAHQGEIKRAKTYLEMAHQSLMPSPQSFIAMGGLSGSGKSTKARAGAPQVGACPGAVHLRSDEIRKRLWHWPSLEPLPKEAYASSWGSKTYETLMAEATEILRAGQSLICDATFTVPKWREACHEVVSACQSQNPDLKLEGQWLELGLEERLERVRGRTGDVSDADETVARGQIDAFQEDESLRLTGAWRRHKG